MKFTLAQAADKVGLNRSTLLRAIKKGKLSAELQENKTYLIDSSELYRVYDIKKNDDVLHQGTPMQMHQPAQDDLINALQAQIELLKDQVRREQDNADHWRNQATLLLTYQPEPKKMNKTEADSGQKSLLFEKLFGKK